MVGWRNKKVIYFTQRRQERKVKEKVKHIFIFMTFDIKTNYKQ